MSTDILEKPTETPTMRDNRGRFLVGMKALPGAGRPKSNRCEQNLKTWNKLVKSAHIRRVYFALLNGCLKGDTKAIALFLDRVLGKVIDTVNVNQTVTQVESPESIRQNLIERIADLGRN